MKAKPEFLTTEQVAKLLQIHVVTVRRLIKAGKLPAVRIGGQWRLDPADIKREGKTKRD